MPNRIIKESICTSDNLNKLSPEEEIFFYRLLVNCDDYGRLDARPIILLSRCFPLKSKILTETIIVSWLQKLVDCKLLYIYTIDGRYYLQIETWEKHQQIRAKKSKYPNPNGTILSNNIYQQMLSIDSNITIVPDLKNTDSNMGNQTTNNNHLISNDIKCPRNPIQSNRNPIVIHKYTINKKVYEDVVYLSDVEYDKLLTQFGEEGTKERILKLSLYIKSKGKKYKSHYATILIWEHRNNGDNNGTNQSNTQANGQSSTNNQKHNKYTSGKYGKLVQT
jgi:hypothetical protein